MIDMKLARAQKLSDEDIRELERLHVIKIEIEERMEKANDSNKLKEE